MILGFFFSLQISENPFLKSIILQLSFKYCIQILLKSFLEELLEPNGKKKNTKKTHNQTCKEYLDYTVTGIR